MSGRALEQETEIIIDNIRKYRKEKKISILTLATNVGISHSHLFYIESKRSIPSIDLIIKIAKALDLTPEELLSK